MQFYESSYFLLARKSIRYPQQRQYQKLGIIVYLFTNRDTYILGVYLTIINVDTDTLPDNVAITSSGSRSAKV